MQNDNKDNMSSCLLLHFIFIVSVVYLVVVQARFNEVSATDHRCPATYPPAFSTRLASLYSLQAAFSSLR